MTGTLLLVWLGGAAALCLAAILVVETVPGSRPTGFGFHPGADDV
jgi:hypothetical protein